ncbi:12003_t:CDS:2 [Entrophospora sp. SA101]|nr:12003_t:CDS:2 [Entrophospora sp. SA101]
MTRTLSIAIKENTYQHLKKKIKPGKISSFVNQAVEKKLKELSQAEKQEKEQLRKRLIVAYQRQAKNKKLQSELALVPANLRGPQTDSSLLMAIPLTTEDIENIEPFEVLVKNTKENGLDHPSKLQFNYPRTFDRVRLRKHLGILNRKFIEGVKKA